MSARISFYSLSTARRNKENVQRTQITFPSDKASLPRRTRHNNVSLAPFFLKAACSTLDPRSSYMPIFLSQRFLRIAGNTEGRGRGRYQYFSRIDNRARPLQSVSEERRDREKYCVTAILRAKCLPREPGGGREILYGCVLYAERRVCLALGRKRKGEGNFTWPVVYFWRPTCLETRLAAKYI